MLDVITIGSATKDVFLISKGFKLIESDEFSTGYGECFAYGGKVEVANIYYDTGGGATNAAATFSNLGVSAGIYTKIGRDSVGEEIKADLKQRGVKVSTIVVHPNLGTGYSTIMLSKKGDRSILVYRGASSAFEAKDLKAEKLRSRWFYLTSSAGNLDFVKKVFSIAKKNKTKVFWNPGSGEVKRGLMELKPYLKRTAVLSVNREEAEKLTGSKDLAQNLRDLSKLCEMVWITDGKKGAYLANKEGLFFMPATGTKPLNTTGAGDAFGSGFVAGYIKTEDWRKAARIATLNADGVIQAMGAKNGLINKIPSKKKLAEIKINSFINERHSS